MEDYKQTLYNDELLNILPDGVIIFDTNGEVIQLNQQAFAELHVHPSVNDMLPFPTNRLFKLLNKKELFWKRFVREKIRIHYLNIPSCKNRLITHNFP
jgi:PAS domain-containing protein